jgi:sensor histidine kinase regulating citrate/malate metabolism
MNFGLRVRLIGTLIFAILVFFAISAIAANSTMSGELSRLGRQQVQSGATGLAGYWDEKKDQVRLLTQQVAIQDAIRRNVATKNSKALSESLTNIARQAGLSFLTIVDLKGKVLGRANGGPSGVPLNSPFITRALTGETVSTATSLSAAELAAEQLAPQVIVDVKSTDGKTSRKMDTGLGLIAAAPISDANERTIGAIYGGILMNHYYDVVDQATRALGGKAAIVLDNAIVASSISRSDGTRLVDADAAFPTDSTKAGKPYLGNDTEAGVPYLAEVDPIIDDQNAVIGARWYGVPLSQFTDIQNHTLQSLLVWGLLALFIALLLAVPVVESLCRALIKRSKQVRASTKELAVIVVGGEVSGDHVAQTKAAVERQSAVLAQSNVAEATALNAEILGDVVVIDMLAQEMSERMKQATTRVNELNDVAEGLNELVTGTKN